MSDQNNFAKFFMSQPVPINLWAPFTEVTQRIAARYREFTVRALSMGLTMEQAKAILNSEPDPEACLERYACYGYLPVRLGEVLTQEELAGQVFAGGTVLNGDWMDRRYAKAFAEMSRDRQRGLVKAGIELALQTEWPLERAMAAVMPYLEEA